MSRCIWIWGLLCALAAPVQADDVELSNGDTLHGTIVERNDAVLVLDHPVLGRLEIPRDRIVDPAAIADAPTPPAGGGLFGTQLLTGWQRSFALGFAGSEGSAQELHLNSQLAAGFEDERDRWAFDSTYFFSAVDGEAESNELAIQLTKDWLIPDSRWFLFADSRYDYDAFKDWDHRVAVSLGVGAEIVQRERWDLLARLGVGGFRTIGGSETLAPEAALGFEANWRVSDGQTVKATSSLYPDLSELGELRTISQLDWVLALAPLSGFHLKLSLLHEYESIAADEPSDLKYVGALGYDF